MLCRERIKCSRLASVGGSDEFKRRRRLLHHAEKESALQERLYQTTLNRHDAHRAHDVLALLLPSLAVDAAELLLPEKRHRRLRRALTLVVRRARIDLLVVLQVARDELASVLRPAIQVMQITVVGAEVRVARYLRLRAARHETVTSALAEVKELKVCELLVSCEALRVKLFAFDGPFHDGICP